MRSKADETFVIVETLICPLQISHSSLDFKCTTAMLVTGIFNSLGGTRFAAFGFRIAEILFIKAPSSIIPGPFFLPSTNVS